MCVCVCVFVGGGVIEKNISHMLQVWWKDCNLKKMILEITLVFQVAGDLWMLLPSTINQRTTLTNIIWITWNLTRIRWHFHCLLVALTAFFLCLKLNIIWFLIFFISDEMLWCVLHWCPQGCILGNYILPQRKHPGDGWRSDSTSGDPVLLHIHHTGLPLVCQGEPFVLIHCPLHEMRWETGKVFEW